MRFFIAFSLLFALPLISEAQHDMDSCGLGWEVTNAETMVGTTIRGTTNTFVPPSFGMTTGTIGCKKLDFAANESPAVNYVVNSYSNLKQELAMGQGEYVEGLKEVMSCPQVNSIRSQYNQVVAPAKDGIELYQNLKSYCQAAI